MILLLVNCVQSSAAKGSCAMLHAGKPAGGRQRRILKCGVRALDAGIDNRDADSRPGVGRPTLRVPGRRNVNQLNGAVQTAVVARHAGYITNSRSGAKLRGPSGIRGNINGVQQNMRFGGDGEVPRFEPAAYGRMRLDIPQPGRSDRSAGARRRRRRIVQHQHITREVARGPTQSRKNQQR